MANYGMSKTVVGSLGDVKEKVAAALKTQGFGILTEIDVQKTLKEKIGAEVEPYLILGACNPSLAHQLLGADRHIGLLLPCNVVLQQAGSGVEVSIQDPEVMFSVVDAGTNEVLLTFPKEIRQRLQSVLEKL